MENIELGLNLMVIGMTTVFAILFLVVMGGKILILLVNKFYPEIPVPHTIVPETSSNKLAAIVAAVDIVTSGKGKIDHIRGID